MSKNKDKNTKFDGLGETLSKLTSLTDKINRVGDDNVDEPDDAVIDEAIEEALSEDDAFEEKTDVVESADENAPENDISDADTEELDIPDEWVDDEDEEELLNTEKDAGEDKDSDDEDAILEEEEETILTIDVKKSSAVAIDMPEPDVRIALDDDDDDAEADDDEPTVGDGNKSIDDIAEEFIQDEFHADALESDSDSDFNSSLDSEGADEADEVIAHQTYMKDVEDALGDELVGLAENEGAPTMLPGYSEEVARDKAPENVFIKSEDPSLGHGEEVIVASIVDAIYDRAGVQICLDDEMAYHGDWDPIGKVIGIGDGCFFTLSGTVATGKKKNSYGETEICQWNLYDEDGNIRDFYHYQPDSLERIVSLIPTDYDIDDLVERFRRLVSKERKGGRIAGKGGNDPRV